MNFRKTTDPDEEVSISAGVTTEISLNLSLHPKDIEKLYPIIFDFLKNQCQNTNRTMEQFRQEYESFKNPPPQ